jgi:Fe-S cluster assembly protein SufD
MAGWPSVVSPMPGPDVMGTVLQQTLATQPGNADNDVAHPDWFVARQQQARQALAGAHWPTRKDEAWKYTSLHELAQQAPQLRLAALPDPVTDAALAFVAGSGVDGNAPPFMRRLAHALAAPDSTLLPSKIAVDWLHRKETVPTNDVFDLINTAFANDGVVIDVPAGFVDDDWYRIHMRGADSDETHAAQHWHLSHRIDLADSAHVRLHFDQDGVDGTGLATIVSDIRIGRGAHLELAWTRAAGTLASIARTRIELQAGARLTLHVLDAGAAPSRHDLTVVLTGEGAQADLGGVFLLDGRQHADLQLDLRHDSPDAVSHTTWRAIANDRSRAVFSGQITVAKGADGTDAQLGCKSLLGSAQAEIDAKPVLVIHADDVKCAHGATVGQLDAQALFYLRSRGIDREQARAMLMRAFAVEAFADQADSPAATRLAQWLEVGS